MEVELDVLARRLAPREGMARAVMISGVGAQSGASTIAAGLARAAARQGVDPIWLYDLDFTTNPQARRARLNGQAYSGALDGAQFWRTAPAGAGRLAMRKLEGAPIFVSRFEREPGAIRALQFQSAPQYWTRARQRSGLTLVDAPSDSAALATVAADLDGVILVADARTTGQSQTLERAEAFRAAGAKVLGVVVNRSSASAQT